MSHSNTYKPDDISGEDTRPAATDKDSAIHEAGHVVMAYLYNWRIESVTIEEKPGEYVGCAMCQPRERGVRLMVADKNKRGSYRARSSREIAELANRPALLIYAAGLAATELMGRNFTHSNGSAEDFEAAMQVAQTFIEDEDEAAAHVNKLHMEAVEILAKPGNFGAVLALGAELLKKRTLSGKEARAIVWHTLRDFQAAERYMRPLRASAAA